jgi:hypothetical protein
VSSRTHTQPEEDDLVDEGAEARGRSGREGQREHFNTIRPMILTKQEWSVKEKTSTPVLTASDNDMDLLDNNESPLIKDGSPPPTDMDINMVFTLPPEFRGAQEEVTQMYLGPMMAMFENLEESSKHLKPLYIRGHIDGKLISGSMVVLSST